MPISDKYILYLDLETTGNKLDDEVIELGIVCLDSKTFEELGFFQAVVNPSQKAMHNLTGNSIVKNMHTVNGLLADIEDGEGVSAYECDILVNDWINQFHDKTDHIPYGGSGVLHFDRQYINKDLPKFSKRITYWAYDAAVLRRVWKLVGAETMPFNEDNKTHRALDDARLHADELRFYAKQIDKIGRYDDLE